MKDVRERLLLCLIILLISTTSAFAYYNPQAGRFMQRDPLGVDPAGCKKNPLSPSRQYDDGMVLYEYANSDPLNNVDSFGMLCIEIIPPSTPVWNTPAGPACNAYNGCGAKGCALRAICNSAGSGCWANCVRGCLLSDWDSATCSYSSGGATIHLGCWQYCDAKCHGYVVICSGSCPCPLL